MNELNFFMAMEPPTTTQQMHKVRVTNGRPVFYEPAEVKAARAKLMAHLAQHKPNEPMAGPLALIVKWCFLAGNGHEVGTWRITKPDTDNIQKMLKDCMTACGYWRDDAQVCREIVEKFWWDVPGIYIYVRQL